MFPEGHCWPEQFVVWDLEIQKDFGTSSEGVMQYQHQPSGPVNEIAYTDKFRLI